MKMQINHHFNFNQDIFNLKQMKDCKYDVGELRALFPLKKGSFQFFKKNPSLKKAAHTVYYKASNGNIELTYNKLPFSIETIFKKSSLEDWEIYIKDSSHLEVDCWILNSLLSLGAQLTVKDYRKLSPEVRVSTYYLSLQHGVRIIESSKE